MTLAQIAINNLRRRKAKMALVLSGLAIGIATAVSLYSIVDAMKAEMASQMASYGTNIVITADAGEISFTYGGISIPEVLFDVEKLSSRDAAAISNLPAATMVKVIIPRLWSVMRVNGQDVVVVGSDLRSDFSIKPWLRVRNLLDQESAQAVSSTGGMAGGSLDLSREDFEKLQLREAEVILGANASYNLSLFPGSTFILNGREFRVAAILQKNGSSEDDQILMDLAVAQEIMGRPDELSVIEISADYNLGSEEMLLSQLETSLPNAKITSLSKVMLDRNELVTRLARFGTAISVIVLVAGLIVAMLTMSGAVQARTREIGIFRAIGFHKTHIAQIIMLEGLIVSAVGGLIGFALGMAIASFAGPLLADARLTVPWQLDILLLAVLLSVVIGSLAGLYPAWRATRLDPAEALRDI